MDKRALLIFSAMVVALTACVQGNNSTNATASTAFQARYSPLSGIGPFPNDLYFKGSTTGTLNIPFASTSAAAAPANAALASMNHLDGFGTQSVINAYFSASINPATLNAGDLFVFKVTANPQNKAIDPTKGATPLVPGADCTASRTDYTVGVSPAVDSGDTVLNIMPCHPLAGGSTYLVVLTNGIKDTNGDAASASSDYALILAADLPVLSGGTMGTTGNAQLDQVALFTLPQLAVAAGAGISPQSIVLTFSFSTQYIGATFAALEVNTPAGTGALADTGLNTSKVLPAGASPGYAEIYAGTLKIPYYLSVATPANPAPALTGFWHTASGGDTTVLSPMAAATTDVTIPMLATLPIANNGANGGCPAPAAPASGWPVVIFQHGITQDRENVFAVADSLAKACIAAVAIDLPLHGVTSTTDPFYQNQLFAGTPAAALMTGERTFNLPEVAPFFSTPSSTIAPSGSYFINLSSLLTSRDNLREAVVDLISLRKGIPGITAFGTSTDLFDGSQISFVGHSLGAIVGTSYLAVDGSHILAATLANPGGDITQLLLKSPSFLPQINAGLQAAGLTPNTQFYDDYFRSAQSVIEAGDPANYAAAAAANDPIHMLEVVGGFDACSLPDQVVPNSSTDLLASLMNLTQVHANSTVIGTAVHGIVRFTAGTHGSLLSPAPPPNCPQDATVYGGVTLEMQTEMATFMATHGTVLQVGNVPFVQ
ncbi:MAG: Ig-like domain-containing protein [Gammaproteobacteria bacterium]|nr:Ig-like domain-containing protein [Gammaproteobacteria bacterium]